MQTTGQTVLITGGSAGIGLALAEQFLQHNNQVIITGRDADKLAQAKATHPTLETYQADMGSLDDVTRLSAQMEHVTVLINNAGVQYNYTLSDQNISAVRIVDEIAINLTGPLTLTRLMMPSLLKQTSAAIVNISSSLGYVPKQNAAVYSATKAGLHQFTRALRWQLEHTSVRVFEVVPPLVETSMTQGRSRRKITPQQLAEAVLSALQRDQMEIVVGAARMLLTLNQYAPGIAERLIRHS